MLRPADATETAESWRVIIEDLEGPAVLILSRQDLPVLEGTEAVTAHDVLEVFAANAERIQKVVLDLIGRFPADLDALGARAALDPTRGDGHAMAREDIRLFETGL